MRVLKVVAFMAAGVVVGVIATFYVVVACSVTGEYVLAYLILTVSAIIGGFGALFFLRTPIPQRVHTPLTPDAERDARAKFLPSSDTAADDPSIQPDKRGLTPGDR
jgi:hypothetical protein